MDAGRHFSGYCLKSLFSLRLLPPVCCSQAAISRRSLEYGFVIKASLYGSNFETQTARKGNPQIQSKTETI